MKVGDLARRLLLLEEQAIKSEERLAISVTNLAKTSMWADKSLADQNNMMNVCSKKSENIDDIEKQLKEALLQQTESGMAPFSITKKSLVLSCSKSCDQPLLHHTYLSL